MNKEEKLARKTLLGTVVSDRMQKTIVVRVDSRKMHNRYNRLVRKSIKFKAHDEKNSAKIGDRVRITETRPLSKEKRWRLVEIVGSEGGRQKSEDRGQKTD